MINTVSAFSIIDAVYTQGEYNRNKPWITQCIDGTASNYGSYAPCLYIRERAYRWMPSKTNTNNDYQNTSYRNSLEDDLIDTSSWYGTHISTNDRTIVDSIAGKQARWITECQDSAADNYKEYAPCLYIRKSIPITITNPNYNNNYTQNNNRYNPFYTSSTLWTSLIDTSSWYRNSNYNTNYNTNSAKIIQELEQFINNADLSTYPINDSSMYVTVTAWTPMANPIQSIMLMQQKDPYNSWNKDVIVIVYWWYNSLTWNYVILSVDGIILTSWTSQWDINSLRSSIFNSTNTNQNHYNNQNNQNYDNQYRYNQNNNYSVPVKPTAQALSLKIDYRLWTKNTDGSYKLTSATCNSNGSTDLIWIEKKITDDYYGVGIEINNTFANQTYNINKWDKLCCNVSNSVGWYQKAGACIIVT